MDGDKVSHRRREGRSSGDGVFGCVSDGEEDLDGEGGSRSFGKSKRSRRHRWLSESTVVVVNGSGRSVVGLLGGRRSLTVLLGFEVDGEVDRHLLERADGV